MLLFKFMDQMLPFYVYEHMQLFKLCTEHMQLFQFYVPKATLLSLRTISYSFKFTYQMLHLGLHKICYYLSLRTKC